MASQKKTSPLVWLAGLVGVSAAAWYFWPKDADAETFTLDESAAVPVIESAPYIPDAAPASVIAASQPYTAVRGDSLSKIIGRIWQDDSERRAEAIGIPTYDAEQLWLLLWSANYSGTPNPNKIKIGETIMVPDLAAFSDADIAKARKYYLKWRSYGPTA